MQEHLLYHFYAMLVLLMIEQLPMTGNRGGYQVERSEQRQAGSLKISEDVIETIAKLATMEIQGVDSLRAGSLSITDVLVHSKTKGPIKINLAGDVAEISISVIIKYGYKITDIAESIQNNVKSAVQSMTGIAVSKVNIAVAGVSFKSAAAN